jgi:hypothetical protein
VPDPDATPSSFRIFLNYRREDSSGHAGRIWDALRYGLGEDPGFAHEQLFMDVDTIDVGDDFGEVIQEAVGSCDVLIAVIGKQWLTASDAKGRRRLDSPNDFVRLEIEAALERGVRVIPALVQGAEMPSSEDLPGSLAPLARRNALELSDTRWRFDVGRLVGRLKELERESVGAAPAERAVELATPEKEPEDIREQQRQVLSEVPRDAAINPELELLPEVLQPDEELLAACMIYMYSGIVGQPGLLAVTSRRLVWLFMPESTVTVNELPYERISRARTAKPGLAAFFATGTRKLVVDAWPRGVTFQDLPPDRAEELAALINERAKGSVEREPGGAR